MKAIEKKVVLIAAIGTSPAVLTETVWALAHPTLKRKPIVPNKVVVITTSDGEKKIREELFKKPDVWKKMCAALKSEKLLSAAGIEFGSSSSILIVPDAKNRDAADLRNVGDNMRAADLMLETIRKYSENSEFEIYASIAGGRKSMGALLLSCMSLLGRKGDHVNHVLTMPEAVALKNVKTHGKFYYPERGATYEYKEGETLKKIAAGKVLIELFDVPFVRIRGWFQEKFKELPPSYGSLVNAVQKEAPPAEALPLVKLDVRNGICYVDGVDCPKVGPIQLGMLYVFMKKVFDRDDQYRVLNNLLKLMERKEVLPKWARTFLKSKRISAGEGSERPDLYSAITKIGNELREKLSPDRLDESLVMRLVPKNGRNGSYDRIMIEGEDDYPELKACFENR